jgi:hypothetical protein
MESKVDFRIARVENYWCLGLYYPGDKEPYEYKVYDSLKLLLSDVRTFAITLEPIELELDESITELLRLRRN